METNFALSLFAAKSFVNNSLRVGCFFEEEVIRKKATRDYRLSIRRWPWPLKKTQRDGASKEGCGGRNWLGALFVRCSATLPIADLIASVAPQHWIFLPGFRPVILRLNLLTS
jgi:hypothetical protein